MIYTSPFDDVQIPDCPLVDFIFENVATRVDKLAIIDGSCGRSLTYGQLLDAIRRTAAGLTARGLRKGDVCAIYSPNVPEYPVAFYAVAMCGGIVTTVNPLYTATELGHQLRDCCACALVTTPSLLRMARQGAKMAGITNIFTFGNPHGAIDLSSFEPCGDEDQQADIDAAQDVVVLPYSSGTTGLPKGVMLTHRNIVANVLQTHSVEQVSPNEVMIATLPFYHIYGMVVVMHQGLRAGATVVTLARFKAKAFFEIIQKYRVTTAYLVPPLVRTLATHQALDSYDVSSLKDVISAAAPLPEVTARACAERIGCRVRQVYGLTESSPLTHIAPRLNPRLNSVGFPVPNTECRVVSVGHGRDAPQGELGEVWVRGPQVMKGYYDSPNATTRMLDEDGWLHTGDIGFADKDNYLYVLDRAKELVKFRGLHYGEHELLRSMVEDIAARRHANERITFQALLLDSVRESVVAIDIRHRVTFWNRGAEALFGYRASDAIGTNVDALIIPDEQDTKSQWLAELSDVRKQGKWQGQALRRRHGGSLIWTDVFVSMVTDVDGTPAGYIAIHRDITELRRGHDMLRESREQLRNLAASLMAVREEERSAIARELHDELGQALTRLKVDLRWLTDRLPPELKTQRALEMTSFIDRMVSTVQQISAELRPAILDDLGLEAAIESQVHDFSSWNGCRVASDLEIDALKPNRERDTAVFRIVQEALTNVARHARASIVSVRASIVGGQLLLEIEDDGMGISEAKWASPHSLGLIGMRERAERLGGRLTVRRRSDCGTVVRLQVPLVDQARTA